MGRNATNDTEFIFSIQLIIKYHQLPTRNMTHNEAKKESIKTDPKLTQMTESAEKDNESSIMTVLHIFKTRRSGRYRKDRN